MENCDANANAVLEPWLKVLCFEAVEDTLYRHVEPLLEAEGVEFDEYSLIQHLESQNFFTGLENLPASLALFAKHFVVRRSFYRLRKRFSLCCWGIRFELMHLRFYRLETAAGKNVTLASDSLIAEFYDDIATLAQATPESVNKLLADFWVRFGAYQRADSAYDVLGIPIDAGWPEIQQAYRALAAKHHPDKGGDADTFVAVKTAYDRLKTLRSTYAAG